MSLFSWDESFRVNVGDLDEQHRRLVGYVNDLYAAVEERRSREVLGNLFDNLIRYTESHFDAEERLMERFAYPDYGSHKAEHEGLKQKVHDYRREFDSSGAALSISLLVFLMDWVRHHIRGVDRKYTGFFNSRGVI